MNKLNKWNIIKSDIHHRNIDIIFMSIGENIGSKQKTKRVYLGIQLTSRDKSGAIKENYYYNLNVKMNKILEVAPSHKKGEYAIAI